jgi:hypothetical protein
MPLDGISIDTVELRRPVALAIICIICHQVFYHPSEHGISSLGKHLFATAYIVKLNTFTEYNVTQLTSLSVNEMPLALRIRPSSRGIPIVSSQSQIIFEIQVIP